MGLIETGRLAKDAANVRRVNENKAKRKMLASWYITMPGIPEKEKEQLEKSLEYNLGKSLIRFIIIYFVLSCIWFFGIVSTVDAMKMVTGYDTKVTKTVIGVVQEDGLTISVKNPNKGEHVNYRLTDIGVDPTGWTYGDRLNTYWSKEDDSTLYSRLTKHLLYDCDYTEWLNKNMNPSSSFTLLRLFEPVREIERRIIQQNLKR